VHLRPLSVELGAWRRLHHPPGGHHRPERQLSDREGGEILMIVRRLSEAKPYEAPNHRDYKSLRVFGAEMGGSQTLIFGISHFLPGGGAGPDASPPEKIYYVLAGGLTGVARGEGEGGEEGGSRSHGPDQKSGDVNHRHQNLHNPASAAAPEMPP